MRHNVDKTQAVLGAAAHREDEDEGEHDSSLDGLVQVPQCQRAGTASRGHTTQDPTIVSKRGRRS